MFVHLCKDVFTSLIDRFGRGLLLGHFQQVNRETYSYGQHGNSSFRLQRSLMRKGGGVVVGEVRGWRVDIPVSAGSFS